LEEIGQKMIELIGNYKKKDKKTSDNKEEKVETDSKKGKKKK